MATPSILVTGGAGYIGSHTTVELLQSGYEVIVFDNLSNASRKSLEAVEHITQKKLTFVEGDVRRETELDELFDRFDIDGVLHFAGHKAVGESTENPLKYYDNNFNGTVQLVAAMQRAQCRTLVFSSSATVYGVPDQVPLVESTKTGAVNPYGRSKLMVEELLTDLCQADPQWRVSLLRYFNPVGAHASGEIGEDPNDIPNNLMPFISQVAVGRLDKLRVFGDDYETPDGTGIRDYIHVVDLAKGHLKALDYLFRNQGLFVHNLGTGNGYSVLDAVKAFEDASDVKIPYEIVERRPGDVAISFADASKARDDLGWEAEYDLRRMCEDAWRWQKNHPMGYGS
jgi:UDP-glucose 4-epimerase